MRGAVIWITGAVIAFLVTAGAFLALANLATETAEESLTPDPEGPPGRPGSTLDLNLNKDRLASLQPEPDQDLGLVVENAGDGDFSDVNLTLKVSSEDTASPQTRYYRHTIADLPAGETAYARFDLDLSGVAPASQSASATSPEARAILEIRATAPRGVSTVRTAIVPL